MGESFQTLRGSSIRLSSRRVCSSRLTLRKYLIRMIPSSTTAFSTSGIDLQEALGLRGGAVAHHELDAGAVVPAAVEDHDLAGRREPRDVALDVHLRADPRVRRRECDVLEDARARPLRDPPDRASLARGVHALEHDQHPGAGVLDPLLHRHELALQDPHVALVLLPLHLPGSACPRPCASIVLMLPVVRLIRLGLAHLRYPHCFGNRSTRRS